MKVGGCIIIKYFNFYFEVFSSLITYSLSSIYISFQLNQSCIHPLKKISEILTLFGGIIKTFSDKYEK